MNKIAIITDSTSDLNAQLREKYNIDYCYMGFSSGDEQYLASLDWEQMSSHDFYESMRSGKEYLTVQVTVKHYIETFSKYLEQGFDIVYIGCSSALSGSVSSAKMLAGELQSEYKGRQIYCVDSLLSGMGQGMMVIKAAILRDEGKSAAQIADHIEKMKWTCNQVGTVLSLEYLKKAGRITASSYFFGNMFAVKPIVISDDQGRNLAIRKVKGRKTSLQETARQVAAYIRHPEDQTVYISHADAQEDAQKVINMVKELIPGVKTEMAVIGPIVGISVGPGTIIAYFQGIEKKEYMKQ